MPIKFQLLLSILFFQRFLISYSQDIIYARFVIDTLASEYIAGRGYYNKNDLKAANFIASEFEKFGVQKFGNSYFQYFNINVNSIVDELFVVLDKDTILAAIDYLFAPWSCSINGSFRILRIDKNILNDKKKFDKIKKQKHNNRFVLIDTTGLNNLEFKEEYKKIVNDNILEAAGVICFDKTLTQSICDEQKSFVKITLRDSLRNRALRKITLKIKSQYQANYQTQNVVGFVEGQTDTFILYTAHYDHLGTMGNKVFFPGANDNAAGVAMVLDLAKTFSALQQKPYYSIAFMLFSAEELGLLGSFYYTEHPIFPLEKIKFVVNLDVVGSGDDGIQIVNSTIFKQQFNLLDSLNKEHKFVRQIKQRGAAANSDHYPFYAKGIPSFFIYSLGSYKEYHNIKDTRHKVPLFAYKGIFGLVYNFALNIN